jgi:hypothetical protein
MKSVPNDFNYNEELATDKIQCGFCYGYLGDLEYEDYGDEKEYYRRCLKCGHAWNARHLQSLKDKTK